MFQLNRDQKTLDPQGNWIEEKCLTEVNQSEQIRYGERVYNLKQIIVHHGGSTLRGHYTMFDVEEMCEFDDTPPSFKSVTEEMMTTAKQEGYIYFYEIDKSVEEPAAAPDVLKTPSKATTSAPDGPSGQQNYLLEQSDSDSVPPGPSGRQTDLPEQSDSDGVPPGPSGRQTDLPDQSVYVAPPERQTSEPHDPHCSPVRGVSRKILQSPTVLHTPERRLSRTEQLRTPERTKSRK